MISLQLQCRNLYSNTVTGLVKMFCRNYKYYNSKKGDIQVYFSSYQYYPQKSTTKLQLQELIFVIFPGAAARYLIPLVM